VLHAAREKFRTQKASKNRHLPPSHKFLGLYLRNYGIYRQLEKRQSEKNLLNSNTSSTCPDNMVNFGPLAAEIGLPVWGTPVNFNGFRGTLVVGVSQTLWH